MYLTLKVHLQFLHVPDSNLPLRIGHSHHLLLSLAMMLQMNYIGDGGVAILVQHQLALLTTEGSGGIPGEQIVTVVPDGSDEEFCRDDFHNCDVVINFHGCQKSQLFYIPDLDCLILRARDESGVVEPHNMIHTALMPRQVHDESQCPQVLGRLGLHMIRNRVLVVLRHSLPISMLSLRRPTPAARVSTLILCV